MKKLMSVAVAALATAAFAKDPEVTQESLSDDAVYTITFNTKYLDYKSSSQSVKATDAELGIVKGTVAPLKGKIVGVTNVWACFEKFVELTNELQQAIAPVKLLVSDYKESTKTVTVWYDDGGKAKKLTTVYPVNRITFKVQDTSKASVVSKTLNGLIVRDKTNKIDPEQCFIWDPKDTQAYSNVFAGTKGTKTVKLATASKADGKKFKFIQGLLAGDKNADGGFEWDIASENRARGWATGKIKTDSTQDDDDKPYVYSSLSGNYAGLAKMDGVAAVGEYGTWKLAYDSTSTKLLKNLTTNRKYGNNVVENDRAGIVEILGKKKVEIVD